MVGIVADIRRAFCMGAVRTAKVGALGLDTVSDEFAAAM